MSSRGLLPSEVVHVQAYTRSGPYGPVDVSEHDRSAPDRGGSGPAAAGRPSGRADRAYLDDANVLKAQRKMEDYLTFFRQNAGRDLVQGVDNGWRLAAKHLAHFLDGTGTPVVLSSEEVARMPALVNAEERARRKFEETFTATTRNDALNASIKGMLDGATLEIRDVWDTGTDSADNRAGDYAAVGRSSVHSEGVFRVVRKGESIAFAGEVTHLLGVADPDPKRPGYYRDPYDFDAGQPGSFPAITLEDAGKAKRFDMVSEPRRQRVTARVRILPGDRLVLDGPPVWEPIR